MSSTPRDSVQIIVAFLGAIGLIGAALINKWNPPPPPSPSLENLYTPEVKSVIQRSMIVGNQAYRNLDSSLLDEVFTKDAFKLLQISIEQYRSLGRKIDSQSQSVQYVSISFTDKPLRAKVRFTRSLRVYAYSLQTDQCVESTPEYQQELTYNLEHQTNGWKIFAIELHTSTPKERLSCP